MPDTTEVAVTNVTIHPLFAREIRPMRDWVEFLERWQAAATINEMLGILHVGFTVSLGRRGFSEKGYDSVDRILFYLSIADGWADSYNILRKPDEVYAEIDYYDGDGKKVQKSINDLRQIVAVKAFDMLCVNIFKGAELMWGNRHGDIFNPAWGRVFTSDRLFPAIQNFFRSEADRTINHREVTICNLASRNESSHNEKFAHEFLLNLARFIWRWRDYNEDWSSDKKRKQEITEQNAATHVRLDPAKPWMVEVLVGMGRLDVLREWILVLDEACLSRLREIALRNELGAHRRHHVNEDRKVTTLDEACYVGSRAAWFLKEHELTVREDKRLAAIREAEDLREEANERLRELRQQQ